MSLQVWLPLNGDLQNKGLDDIKITNQTISAWENGKIGKALKTLNSYCYLTVPSLVNKNIFSTSFWYKCNDASSLTTNWRRILGFVTKDQPVATLTGLLRFESSYGNNYAISVHSNTAYQIMPSNTGNMALVTTKGEWHHIALSCDGEIINIYVDGMLFNSGTQTSGILSGQVRICETGSQADGWMNDLRIYDHCLSPKEVKEISKGLVAHYPLNDGIGNENLITNSLGNNKSTWIAENCTLTTENNCFKLVTTAANRRIYENVSNVWFSEQNYTVSFMAKAETTGIKIDCSRSIADFTSPFTLTTNWKYYKGIITSTATPSGGTLSIRVLNAGTVYLKNIKLEKGSTATPWIPNSKDVLYTELGLDDNIVYDCSGYEHNGTKTSTGISCSSDSPRYSSCMDFETSGYINAGTGGKVTDEITISEWVYENPWTADPHPWSCTESGGWNIQNSNNKPTFPIYVNTVGYVSSIHGDISTPLWTDLSPGWHLFTGTYDGFNVKLYIDGELVANKATGKTDKLPIHYHATNSIFLHREATATGSTGSYAACKLSDFRIYSTALSAEDIKELYETSASIDNHGNIWAYEIQEV